MCVFMYHILVHKNTLLWLGVGASASAQNQVIFTLWGNQSFLPFLSTSRGISPHPHIWRGLVGLLVGFSKSEIPQTAWRILKCHLVGNFMFSWRSRVEIIISQLWPLTLNPTLPMTFLTRTSPWKKIYASCTSAGPLKWTVHTEYSALARFWA